MIDIKVSPLASGKIKIQVKIYQIDSSRSPRFSLTTSLKPRIYWGRQKQTKKIIFNDFIHLPNNTKDMQILDKWLNVHNLVEFKDVILKKYEDHKYIYGGLN